MGQINTKKLVSPILQAEEPLAAVEREDMVVVELMEMAIPATILGFQTPLLSADSFLARSGQIGSSMFVVEPTVLDTGDPPPLPLACCSSAYSEQKGPYN